MDRLQRDAYTLDRDEATLLVIDIQERLAVAMKHKDRAIANAGILLKAAKELALPVVATEQYPKGLGHTVPELLPLINERDTFSKVSFDAYTGDIAEAIKRTGRRKILVAGMETHVCVYQTVRSLIANGYDVHVVQDAVSSRTEENFQSGLTLMQNLGAVITNTETALFDLLKVAGTPEFKALSALIK